MAGGTETIGQRLRRLRLERGLSQRALAEPGVSYAYISRIEAGARQPSVNALRKLARKLGVTADYLETGSDISEGQQRELRLADAELRLRLGEGGESTERALRALLDEALAAGDRNTAAGVRVVLGKTAYEAGRPAESVELLEPATETLLPNDRPDVFTELGRAYAALGRLDNAIALFERCLAETDAEHLAARVRYATVLSYALTDAGELERAQEVLIEIIEQAGEALSDPSMQITLYWSLARLSTHRGQHAVALGHARRALALLEATEDRNQLGRAHLLCGWILVSQGSGEHALAQLAQAENLLGSRPAAIDLAYLRTEQSKAALLLGRAEEAAQWARESLAALGENDPGERGAAWLALGNALELAGDEEGALDAFRRSTAAYEQAGALPDAAEAQRSLGRALRAAGREDEALDAMERAADLGVAAGRAV